MSVGLRHNNSPHDRSCNLEPCRAGAGRGWANIREASKGKARTFSPAERARCGITQLTSHVAVAVHVTGRWDWHFTRAGSLGKWISAGGLLCVRGHNSVALIPPTRVRGSVSRAKRRWKVKANAAILSHAPVSIDPGRLFFFGAQEAHSTDDPVQHGHGVALRRGMNSIVRPGVLLVPCLPGARGRRHMGPGGTERNARQNVACCPLDGCCPRSAGLVGLGSAQLPVSPSLSLSLLTVTVMDALKSSKKVQNTCLHVHGVLFINNPVGRQGMFLPKCMRALIFSKLTTVASCDSSVKCSAFKASHPDPDQMVRLDFRSSLWCLLVRNSPSLAICR
jgi:hypothetical protein